MKLSKEIIDHIMEISDEDYPVLQKYLDELDLVVQPGDSSQSILVENK